MAKDKPAIDYRTQRCVMECEDEDGKERTGRKTLPTCAVCGANMSGWLRKPPAKRLKYSRKLALRSRRMQMVVEEHVPRSERAKPFRSAKVVSIAAARRH